MEKQYNNLQLEAIESKEPKIVVTAPAGSGKTTSLVGAILEYKKHKPDDNIVAITFTRKATEELHKELFHLKKVNVSTIHSWAYQNLIYLSEKLREENPNNTFKVKLLEEARILEILKELKIKRRYYYLNEGVMYSYIVMGNYNMDIRETTKKMFRIIADDYQNFKREMGLYDFTDLPVYLLDKLYDYDEYINDIDALFVDEFQDVDPVQLQVFNRVLAKKKFFIGDADQSIYLFRDATPDILEKLDDFYRHELDVNYRSYQEIIDYASTFQKMYKEERLSSLLDVKTRDLKPSHIKCERGYGAEIYQLGFFLENFLLTGLVSNDIGLIKDIFEDDHMILCRTNKQVKAIREFGINKVTTIHQAKGLEWNSVILTDFSIDEEQEMNVGYVGLTRAKNRLLVADYGSFFNILSKMYEKKEHKKLF